VDIATAVPVSGFIAKKTKQRRTKRQARFMENAFSKLYPETLCIRLKINEKRRGLLGVVMIIG
jgi:hypothetical protein